MTTTMTNANTNIQKHQRHQNNRQLIECITGWYKSAISQNVLSSKPEPWWLVLRWFLGLKYLHILSSCTGWVIIQWKNTPIIQNVEERRPIPGKLFCKIGKMQKSSLFAFSCCCWIGRKSSQSIIANSFLMLSQIELTQYPLKVK